MVLMTMLMAKAPSMGVRYMRMEMSLCANWKAR